MSALEDLAAHDGRVAEAQARARFLGHDLAELSARVTELRERKISAHADQNESLAGRLRKQIDEGEAKIVDLQERQQGAQLGASRADAERTRWVGDHYHELVVALEPDAKRVAKAIDDLAGKLLDALADWQGVAGRVSGLAHVAGRTNNERAPALGWDELSRELRRRPRPTPLPLPGPRATASIVPEHDPDPEIREGAKPDPGEGGPEGGIDHFQARPTGDRAGVDSPDRDLRAGAWRGSSATPT